MVIIVTANVRGWQAHLDLSWDPALGGGGGVAAPTPSLYLGHALLQVGSHLILLLPEDFVKDGTALTVLSQQERPGSLSSGDEAALRSSKAELSSGTLRTNARDSPPLPRGGVSVRGHRGGGAER